jgi:AmmeMemoRadiSam system protein A
VGYAHRLSEDEQRELLRIARVTLREYTRCGRIPPGKPHRSCFLQGAGAFVTLRHPDGRLRGCIGTQDESTPLYRTVQEMAVAAATRDPRFEGVDAIELEQLVIEISVLGERCVVSTPDEVVIGEHGLAIQCRGQRGLLLPQVATDHSWCSRTFLERVCAKAGLPEDTWQLGEAVVESFTAQVFDEAALGQSPDEVKLPN